MDIPMYIIDLCLLVGPSLSKTPFPEELKVTFKRFLTEKQAPIKGNIGNSLSYGNIPDTPLKILINNSLIMFN